LQQPFAQALAPWRLGRALAALAALFFANSSSSAGGAAVVGLRTFSARRKKNLKNWKIVFLFLFF
jgi:hypothetical protein